MKQRLLVFYYVFILLPLGVSAESFPALFNNNVCTINSEQINVEIKSLYDVTYSVEKEMTFYNKHKSLQSFAVGYDQTSKLKSANIDFYDDSEKKKNLFLKKICRICQPFQDFLYMMILEYYMLI